MRVVCKIQSFTLAEVISAILDSMPNLVRDLGQLGSMVVLLLTADAKG